MDTRHNDITVPTATFAKGISDMQFPKAKERVALIIQLRICLGNTNKFLTLPKLKKVQAWLQELLHLRETLDMRPMPLEIHAELQEQIGICMVRMKELFMAYSPSHFQFIKFHMIMHLPWQIERFGNVHYGHARVIVP